MTKASKTWNDVIFNTLNRLESGIYEIDALPVKMKKKGIIKRSTIKELGEDCHKYTVESIKYWIDNGMYYMGLTNDLRYIRVVNL